MRWLKKNKTDWRWSSVCAHLVEDESLADVAPVTDGAKIMNEH